MKFHLLMFLALSAISPIAAQAVPSSMTYQGRLTDASSTPLPNGTGYEIEIRLWSASSGGSLLWGTRYTGVPLSNGAFSLILGAGGIPIPGATTTDLKAAFNTHTVHLGLTATKNASGSPISSPAEILPRQQIFSSPYAFRAETAAVAESVRTDGLLSGAIKDGEVMSSDIANSAVQTVKLADHAVTTTKIANGTILGEDLAVETIAPDRLSRDFACVVDEKPSGVSGGNAVASNWNRRDLNKIAYSQGNSVTLSGNAIILKPGTYLVEGQAPAYEARENRIVLRRTGETAALIYGIVSRNTGGACPVSSFSGIVTVSAPSESFEVWHYISINPNGANTLGVPIGVAGIPEIYTTVKINRLK